MKDSGVHRFCKLLMVFALCGLLAGIARADTLHLTDGTTVSGEVATMDDKGVVVKQADGTFTDHIPWNKLTQEDLRTFEQNPKAAAFVEPWIELTQADKAERTKIEVKDFPHPQRPAKGSLIGGLTTSGLGVFMLLVLYGANIYAAYEISIFRARPAGVVCGVAAVLPVIGPIIFLSMQPALNQATAKPVEEWQPPTEEYAEAAAAAPGAAAPAQAAGTRPASRPAAPGETPAEAEAPLETYATEPAAPAGPALPPTKTFLRGQYTFNRRFFETQMPSFFGVARAGADKDMVLYIRAARGAYVGQRIPRIAANELHLQVQKQNASEEVVIPFVEIQEVQLKHKDA